MKAAGKANSILRQLKQCFKSWTIQTFKLLYTTFVRPHLKYAVSAWNPHLKSDVKILEKVQRRATKMVREIRHLRWLLFVQKIQIRWTKRRRCVSLHK